MDNATERVTARINEIQDEELRNALKIVWAKRMSMTEDRNQVDWGIDGTTGTDDEDCLIIGITQW